MANSTRMAALSAAITKPRPVSTTTRSMAHSADGDQNWLVSRASGLPGPVMPSRPRPNTSASTTSR
jgi:hypothetical protein